MQGAGGAVTDWCGHELKWFPPEQPGASLTAGFPDQVLATGDLQLHRLAMAKLCKACEADG